MIYIVTGHPRSGTNMMVRCAIDGGIPAVYDKRRESLNQTLGDEHYTPNPSGFWEVGYDKFTDPEYMANLKDGHVYNVKLEGLSLLPKDRCKVVLMRRDPREIQSSFIALDGSLKNEKGFVERYAKAIDEAIDVLKERGASWQVINYRDLVFNSDSIKNVDWPLDFKKAQEVINPEHYRHRIESIISAA